MQNEAEYPVLYRNLNPTKKPVDARQRIRPIPAAYVEADAHEVVDRSAIKEKVRFYFLLLVFAAGSFALGYMRARDVYHTKINKMNSELRERLHKMQDSDDRIDRDAQYVQCGLCGSSDSIISGFDELSGKHVVVCNHTDCGHTVSSVQLDSALESLEMTV